MVFDMSGTLLQQLHEWEIRIGAMEIGLQVGNPFPDEGGFYGSLWWLWEDRIKSAQNSEEKEIQTRYQAWKNQLRNSAEVSFDPDEWASDDYWETCRVTNSMYAALVVSIWSQMETFLKSLASICTEASGKRIDILMEVQKFCEDSQKGEDPKTTLDDCIKALNKIKDPYKFDEIKKRFKSPGIEVERCKNYPIVDALRILSNSYKHADGRHRPKENKSI